MIKFIQQFKSKDSIKSKIASGGLWIGGANLAEQGFRFLRNAILARILFPEDFGLMAIVLAFNTFFESFTDVGIKQSIIHNEEGEANSYLNSAWWFSLCRSVMLYIIAFIGAPYIAEFYNEPLLTQLLRFTFLGILFKGAMNAKAYSFLKQLKFKQWVIIYNSGSFVGIAAAIVLAYIYKNVWALAIGFIIEWIVRFVLSYIIVPFFPTFKINKEHLISLLKYARGMLGLPILTFIFIRTDIFVLGKLVSSAELGLYSLAAALAFIPLRLLTKIISDTVMPAFSKIQNDINKLNNGLFKVTNIISILSFPMLMFAFLYKEDILVATYGNKYISVALPFVIIFTTSIFRLFGTPIAGLYLAIGKPQLHRLFTFIRAIIIVILIYPLIKTYGLNGAALAGFISMFVSLIFQVINLRKIINIDFKRYSFLYFKGIILALLIGSFGLLTKNLFILTPILNVSFALILNILFYVFFVSILYKLNFKIIK